MNFVYGPIKSVRYGTTLGINPLGPDKVCSFNCVYCHLGPTLNTMNQVRKDFAYPSLEILKQEFKSYIQQSVKIDAIVISGNGEPTLYPEFEQLAQLLLELRGLHLPGKSIVVLTNGAHLDSKKVINGLNLIDERVIKIDVGQDGALAKINAPLVRLNMAKLLSGVRKLKDCVVQSLFVKGNPSNFVNENIEEWIEILGMIKPKNVQITTLSRPSKVLTTIEPVSDDDLYSIAFKLKKRTGLEAQVFTATQS